MYEWGITHAWINTILVLLAGIFIIAFRRWMHLRWLVCYIFYSSISVILYMGVPIFNNYAFFTTRRFVAYLLLLGMIVEIFRKDFREKPWWIYPSLVLIVISALFFPPYDVYYFIPRVIPYLVLAFSLQKAIKNSHLPLFAFSLMAVGAVISDVLKSLIWLNTTDILKVQRAIDPWWSTAVYAILLGGILWPEIVRLLKKSLVIKDETNAGYRHPANVVSFPLSPQMSNPAMKIDRIDKSIDEVEDYLKKAAVASTLANKEFLTLDEVSDFLSLPRELAAVFIEEQGLERITPVKGAKYWIVRKRDILKAIAERSSRFDIEDELM